MVTKTKTPDLTELLGVPVQLEDVDESQANQIKSSRGRQEGQDIAALREIVRESLASGKAKAFTNVTSDEQRDLFVRKVRQAGKGAGPNGEDVTISTSFNRASQTLYWGPKEVIDALTGKTGKRSSSAPSEASE